MNKWAILTGYAIVVASSQMLWLTYASIDSNVAPLMHTSVDNVVLLSLIFPLTYIILAIPTSKWLDRNFVSAITVGAIFNASGSVIRLFVPGSFLMQAISQTITSIGQPFILGSISIVAVYYFSEKERPMAISLGSLAIFVGIIAATAVGPLIFDYFGYFTMLVIESIPGILGLFWIVVSLKGAEIHVSLKQDMVKFRYNRFHYKLAIMLFVGMGVFDALESWLQPIMTTYSMGNYAPDLLTLMTFMGIIGAAILPQFTSRFNKRKLAVYIIIIVSIFSLLTIGLTHNLLLITGSLALEGFFLLAGLPIIIEWAESATLPQHQGQVTNLLMLTGNAGGLVMIAMGYATEPVGNWMTSIALIVFMLVLIPVLLITPSVVGRNASIPS